MPAQRTLTGAGEPRATPGSPRLGALLRYLRDPRAVLGRTFVPGEDTLGKNRVVVVSHVLWVTQFGADPSIINRQILLDNEPHTVIGVLPAGSAFDRAFNQLWRPLAFEPANMTRNFHWMTSFARLKDGVSLQAAQANMRTIGARIERDFPDSNKGWGVVVERYADTLVPSDLKNALLVLMTATVLLLLIGCANLANLALARGVAREREVALRASLGAGRGRLIRQFLTENVLLALCGGTLGIAIGYAAMRWLQVLMPPFSFAREVDIAMDVRVLLFALAALVLDWGCCSAWRRLWQATSPDLTGLIKDGGRGATVGASRKRLRDALIVAEVALAFVLLVGSGLMMRSFFRLLNVDLGFDGSNALTIALPITTDRFPDPTRLNQYLREVRTAVEAVPGVRETALSCAPPMQGACYGMPMQVASRPMVDRANRSGGFYKVVSPSYFSALKLTVERGRAVSDRDIQSAPPVLVINERLAKREFANDDPIGQRLLIQEIPSRPNRARARYRVGNCRRGPRRKGQRHRRRSERRRVRLERAEPRVHFQTLIVRTSVEPLALQRSIASAIHRVDKDQALTDIRTIDQIKDLSVANNRLQSVLLGIFAAVALVLAGIGIYGVISYSVAQRTQELGIRAALGASEQHLLNLVLGHGLFLTSAGLHRRWPVCRR